MLHEMTKLEMFRNYKNIRIVFKNTEGNIKDLQMLIFLGKFKDPVFATKSGSFEITTMTAHKKEKINWLMSNYTTYDKKVLSMKKTANNKFNKFCSKLAINTNWEIKMKVLKELQNFDTSTLSTSNAKNKKAKIS